MSNPHTNNAPFQNAHQDYDDSINLMDSHFGDFDPMSFPDLTTHANLLAGQDGTSLGIDHSTAGHPHSVSTLDATHDAQRSSIEGSEDGFRDGGSPALNSMGDDVDDDFDQPGHGRADGTDLGVKIKDDKDDAPPAWSELKTKAGKERKRLPLACIACRRKKIRCSGEKPACKHCLKSRIPCVYKVTTRRAAPRTDYMAMLDKRLKRMEERIIKVVPKSEQDSATPITRAALKPAIPGTVQSANVASKKRAANEAFGQDLEAWVKSAGKLSNGPSLSTTGSDMDESLLFREGVESLPSRDIQEHLAEVFFDSVYGQAYHLLHKPSYIRKLKNGELPPVLVLSVCAISARFAHDPSSSSATRQFLKGEEWASHARDICTKRYDWPNITILTCLLILGLHEFGTCQGGRSWALGGQAIRMAFALQLHKDLEYDPMGRNGKTKLSFIDREIRRRIMWACFLMDRFNSSGTERPMFIREEVMTLPLPVHERNFQQDLPATTETLDGPSSRSTTADDAKPATADRSVNMGVAAYTVRCVALWGRIVSYLVQGGKESDPHPIWKAESHFGSLTRAAEGFGASLPESLKGLRENIELHDVDHTVNQFLFMHIALQHNILFLSRTAATTLQAPDDFRTQARAKMLAAANHISEFLQMAETTRHFVATPFAGYCAFSATTVQISTIFSRNPLLKAAAEKNAGLNIRYLHRMMKYWGMFQWMVESIRTQYKSALDGTRNGAAGEEKSRTIPLLQYGDWFDKYPHGVTDSDLMDTVFTKKEKGADGVLEPKSELQSVEDFVTTLSPTINHDNREGPRAHVAKRRSTAKKQASINTGSLPEGRLAGPGRRHSDQMTPRLSQQDQRRFSTVITTPVGPGTPMGFNPVPTPHGQMRNPGFNGISPISPLDMSHFGSHVPSNQAAHLQQNILNMNPQQHAHGHLHQRSPLDGHGPVMFDNYAMGSTSMRDMQGLMEGAANWDGMATDPRVLRQIQQRQAIKRASNLQEAQGRSQMQSTSAEDMFSAPDASSAWLMPFNMEPPELNPELNLELTNFDAGTYGSASGMTPMDRIRHVP